MKVKNISNKVIGIQTAAGVVRLLPDEVKEIECTTDGLKRLTKAKLIELIEDEPVVEEEKPKTTKRRSRKKASTAETAEVTETAAEAETTAE